MVFVITEASYLEVGLNRFPRYLSKLKMQLLINTQEEEWEGRGRGWEGRERVGRERERVGKGESGKGESGKGESGKGESGKGEGESGKGKGRGRE